MRLPGDLIEIRINDAFYEPVMSPKLHLIWSWILGAYKDRRSWPVALKEIVQVAHEKGGYVHVQVYRAMRAAWKSNQARLFIAGIFWAGIAELPVTGYKESLFSTDEVYQVALEFARNQDIRSEVLFKGKRRSGMFHGVHYILRGRNR